MHRSKMYLYSITSSARSSSVGGIYKGRLTDDRLWLIHEQRWQSFLR
jgi:hypothetical protein